ncbi:MAG TPA: hypothetical protein PKD83_10950 [Ignavibacteria bacterium]|nr:hypothetical protein [Ignavibacteria bacterium]
MNPRRSLRALRDSDGTSNYHIYGRVPKNTERLYRGTQKTPAKEAKNPTYKAFCYTYNARNTITIKIEYTYNAVCQTYNTLYHTYNTF